MKDCKKGYVLVPVRSLKVNSENSTQTMHIGEQIGQLIMPTSILCLHGTLGAGKTTLVRGIATGWQSKDRVSSPTYTIVNIYRHQHAPQRLFHIDAYRLDSDAAIESSGLEDIFDEVGAVVIEWPSKVSEWLPEDVLHIYMTPHDELPDIRQLSFESRGSHHTELLAAIASKIEMSE